jgi:hypothetical protein
MAANRITLGKVGEPTRPWLHLAEYAHQEALREWRNAHSHRFHHQMPITVEGQRQWFEAYLSRPDDYLFMVMEGMDPIGCLGIRFIEGAWDVYNVLRGRSSTSSVGFMSQALAMMIEFALRLRAVPVKVEVLADNPALSWYLRNGFVMLSRDSTSIRLLHRGQAQSHPEALP